MRTARLATVGLGRAPEVPLPAQAGGIGGGGCGGEEEEEVVVVVEGLVRAAGQGCSRLSRMSARRRRLHAGGARRLQPTFKASACHQLPSSGRWMSGSTRRCQLYAVCKRRQLSCPTSVTMPTTWQAWPRDDCGTEQLGKRGA